MKVADTIEKKTAPMRKIETLRFNSTFFSLAMVTFIMNNGRINSKKAVDSDSLHLVSAEKEQARRTWPTPFQAKSDSQIHALIPDAASVGTTTRDAGRIAPMGPGVVIYGRLRLNCSGLGPV